MDVTCVILAPADLAEGLSNAVMRYLRSGAWHIGWVERLSEGGAVVWCERRHIRVVESA